MSRLAIPDIRLLLDEHVEQSFTSIGASSDRVLGISTAVPGRDFELISCYLHEPKGALGASHLELGGDPCDEGTYRIVPADMLGAVQATWCLLDHAAHVRERLAARFGGAVMIDVPDFALERATGAWLA